MTNKQQEGLANQQTNESVTSVNVFSMSLRYIKQDLREALERVESVMSKIGDEELTIWLKIAQDQIVDTLNEIENREEKVESLKILKDSTILSNNGTSSCAFSIFETSKEIMYPVPVLLSMAR
jgi:hypothetical protein